MDKDTQKRMAEKLLEASEDMINRNIKDSVFCDLFGKPEYLIQLYRNPVRSTMSMTAGSTM